MRPTFDSCQIPTAFFITSSKIKRSVDDKRMRTETKHSHVPRPVEVF